MKRLILLVAVVVALVAAAAPAQAAHAGISTVSITSAPDGAFSATGLGGCATGQTATTSRTVLRSLADGVDLLVGKRLTCDDGSGTLDLLLYVQIRFTADSFTDKFAWAVTGGTGRFAGAFGGGTGVGIPTGDDLVDHYAGWILLR